jgi:anti-anti-sigma regulatory factor
MEIQEKEFKSQVQKITQHVVLDNDAVIYFPQADIVWDNLTQFQQDVHKVTELMFKMKDFKKLVIDCNKVNNVDSMGKNALLAAHDILEMGEFTLILKNVHYKLYNVLMNERQENYFPIPCAPRVD